MTSNFTSVNSTPSLVSPVIDSHLIKEHLDADSPIKLGIMASGKGSNFEAVAQAIADGKLNAQIQVLIYNNPGILAATRAQKWGVPVVLLNHRDYKQREDFDKIIVETLQLYEVDWVVMAGWMRVVTKVLINAFPNQVINIHPSLLPSFKGIRALEQALDAGVKITGCTVHLVTEEIDSGRILMQAAVPIEPDDTPETLHARVQVLEHRILPEAIILAAQLHNR
ncbi:MAG: phosphoribosylglycinamide formyltransferase [Symploca sp. SIO1C4]|uniref:Phosphoribosylglycinamide formyltransferase n=1 Tax=Symploca sp. SIO1C4 TaxID=2607765 RepID=A0A6B3NG62_9CYAN|nr:phosphoribosylglycinamide formyltransferase [Symploca sp. SIO1C4]